MALRARRYCQQGLPGLVLPLLACPHGLDADMRVGWQKELQYPNQEGWRVGSDVNSLD